jgi:hypothetical protein
MALPLGQMHGHWFQKRKTGTCFDTAQEMHKGSVGGDGIVSSWLCSSTTTIILSFPSHGISSCTVLKSRKPFTKKYLDKVPGEQFALYNKKKLV